MGVTVLAASVQGIESDIQNIYTVLLFTIPLIGILIAAVIAVYFRIKGQLAKHDAQRAMMAEDIDLKLDSVQQQVTAVHSDVREALNGSIESGGNHTTTQ